MGFVFWFIGLFGALVLTTSCATSAGKPGAGASTPVLLNDQGEPLQEVSLRADRSDLEKLRGDIPEDVKKQNDEVAMLMSFVTRESEEDPQRLRDRFSNALRKKREAVSKKVRDARAVFSKKQQDERANFLEKTKSERESFLSGRKRSSDARRDFFSAQEDRRRSFFSEQQEQRRDFELKVQDERKTIDENIRDQQEAFNQEWRAYQLRYTERRKQMDVKKKMDEKARVLNRGAGPVSSAAQASPVASPPSALPMSSDPLAEFDKIPQGPGVKLSPDASGP